MSSDPSTWHGLKDVDLDGGAALDFARECEAVAQLIDDQISDRKSHTTNALQDFEGRFSEIFKQNQTIANTDGDEISTALNDVAKAVRFIIELVPQENERRRDARAWAERRRKEKEHVTVGDAFGDEDPPEGPASPPAPTVESAEATQREDPQPGSGGTSTGTTSARPAELRNFVSGVKGKITELDGKATKLEGLNKDFTAGFNWNIDNEHAAGVDGAAVYSALRLYNQLNEQDKTWVNTVADAFERAGNGEDGGKLTLSNASIANSLRAAGLRTSRYDIPATSPRLYGLKPTTGYSDDPVNASTGNFVEPEADLELGGGSASLQLSRMYNSFNNDAGAFGPGWSSWTEVALVFDDESATLTLPDGRAVVFPRLGDAWDRATGESMWLERDEAADELRATDNDGGTWRFARSGSPLSHDRGEGTMVSFVHEDGRLVRLEHERGRHIALTWDGERVVEAAASDGQTITYTYDEGARLTAATGPLGSRTYRWNDAGLVDAVIDADGVVEVENTYDEQGRVTGQLSPHGRTSRYSYLPGNVTEVADPDGTRSNTWIHDTRGQLIGIVDTEGNRQSTSYDQFGNPVVVTDRDGSVTVREFDDRGRMTRHVAPSGADLEFAYDEQDRVTRVLTGDGGETAYTYEGASRNPSVIVDPEGGETRLEWRGGLLRRLTDPTGVGLRFGYNDLGDLVAVTNADGDTAELDYDSSGRVVAAFSPSGHRTEFRYDGAGLLVERRDPDGAVWRFEHTVAGRRTAVVDPEGSRTTIEYADHGEEARAIDPLGRSVEQRLDDLGNLASVELPDGATWRYSHDGLSRLTGMTTPDGATWSKTYDAAGELTSLTDPTGVTVAATTDQAKGTVTENWPGGQVINRFDPLGRPVSVQQPDGSAVMATYDRCGRPVELLDGEGGLTRIERDPAGRPVAITDPVGDVTRFEYDACGRRSAVIDPAGGRTTWTYDADSRPVRVTLPTGEAGWVRYDAAGRVTSRHVPGVGTARYSYDAVGRLVEAKDTQTGLRRFRYDAAGQVIAVTNGNGGVTRYEYDANGRAVALTDPLGQVTRREFDAMNRCVAETDPLGRTTRAGYDDAGRQIWQEDPRGHRTEWAYDDAGNLSETRIDGELVSSLTHDLRNRTVTVTDHTRADGRVVTHSEELNRRGQPVRRSRDDQSITWEYDAAGRRLAMTLPEGQRVGYAYAPNGRVQAIDHPLLGRASFEYDAAGRLIAATAGSLIQSWSYDAGFVTTHSVADGEGATQTRIERDDDGRITGIDHDGVTTRYDYDKACQLVAAITGGEQVRWRYDTAGRLVSEARDGDTREFTYDEASQLTTETGPAGVTRHDYDQQGRRTRTAYADGRTRDLEWSPTGWLATIVEQTGDEVTRTRLHVDAIGELASINGVSLWWDSAEGPVPTLAQIGSVPVVPAGAVTGIGQEWVAPGWRTSRAQDADPWSAALSGTSPSGLAGIPAGVGVGGAGELSIGGLEWLSARVYDPTTRGFLSVDPLDPVAGAGWSGNPYSYAGNDPLHALDPTGLEPVSEADLKAANAPWYEKTWDFVKKNKDWIIGGLAVVGGAVLMATGVGGPAGAMLMGFGADVLIQKATTGKVNYVQAGVSGLAGGAGFVASKSLSVGRFAMSAKGVTAIKNADMARKVSMRTKVATQASIGSVEGYSYQVAGGADLLSTRALGGAATGMFTGGAGEFASPLADKAGSTVRARVLDGVEDQPWLGRKLTEKVEAPLADHGTKFGVKTGYRGVVGSSGELIRQTTDDDAGIDWGKVGGKGVGSATGGHLPTGWSGPAGRGIATGFDASVS